MEARHVMWPRASHGADVEDVATRRAGSSIEMQAVGKTISYSYDRFVAQGQTVLDDLR